MPCQPSHSGFAFVANINASHVPSPSDASWLEGALACGVIVVWFGGGVVWLFVWLFKTFTCFFDCKLHPCYHCFMLKCFGLSWFGGGGVWCYSRSLHAF